MNRINQKLRSRRGASITYALLLFLVCMVVGSVVLAAGMAAAGRMAKTAEMDQRYYSVTSASDLLAKELAGKPVTITRTRTETTVTTVTTALHDDGSGNITPEITTSTSTGIDYSTVFSDTGYSVTAVHIDGDDETGNTGTDIVRTTKVFLTECAVDLLYGANKANTSAAMGYRFGSAAEKTGTFTLEHSGLSQSALDSGVAADQLKVYGSYTLKSDGTLVIKLSSADDGTGYTLVMTLTALPSDGTPIPSGTGPVTNNSTPGKTITTTTQTSTVTSTIQWKVKSVVKEGA